MELKRIIFMGTPEISSVYLKSLIDTNHNIVAVYSQPARKKGRGMHMQESPVQMIAKKIRLKLLLQQNFFLKLIKKKLKNCTLI